MEIPEIFKKSRYPVPHKCDKSYVLNNFFKNFYVCVLYFSNVFKSKYFRQHIHKISKLMADVYEGVVLLNVGRF